MAMYELYPRRADGRLGGPWPVLGIEAIWQWSSEPLISITAPITLPAPPKRRKHKKGKKHGRS
jgi:hypothetical protein